MRVAFLPRYGNDAASSRLRVYRLADGLREMGHDVSVTGFDDDADVLVLQKTVDPEIFTYARLFGGKVVYDYCDSADIVTLRRAAEVADLLTTDTPGHRRLAMPYSNRINLLFDPIDYGITGPSPDSWGEGAVWFGCWPVFADARWMADVLLRAGVRVRAVSDLTPERAGVPVEIVPWRYETCVDELRQASVAILAHGETDPHKSPDRAVTAIMAGVPCIFSGSVTYARIAHECGVEWADVADGHQLMAAYHRLQRPDERAEYLAATQPVLWQRHNLRAVAERAASIYGAL